MTATSNVPFRKLDDTDPSIVYTGEWFDNPGISGVFNNTLSSTIHSGDTAHIEFIGKSDLLRLSTHHSQIMARCSIASRDHWRDCCP